MRTILLLAAALLAAPLLAQAAQEASLRYDLAAGNLRLGLTEPFGLFGDGGADVGGVTFGSDHFPEGATLLRLALADDASPRVRAVACQDFDLNLVCGEDAAGEPRVEFCDAFGPGLLDGVLADAGVPFAGGVPLDVFVYAAPARTSLGALAAPGPSACPDGALAGATSGLATLRQG